MLDYLIFSIIFICFVFVFCEYSLSHLKIASFKESNKTKAGYAVFHLDVILQKPGVGLALASWNNKMESPSPRSHSKVTKYHFPTLNCFCKIIIIFFLTIKYWPTRSMWSECQVN